MKLLRSWIVTFLCFACPFFAVAQKQETSVVGVFIHERSLMSIEGGYKAIDSLHLSLLPSGKLHFSFSSYFDYGHSCGMSGDAVKVGDHYEYTEALEGGRVCVLKIFHEEPLIRLDDTEAICASEYCGARGRIRGATFYRIQKKEK